MMLPLPINGGGPDRLARPGAASGLKRARGERQPIMGKSFKWASLKNAPPLDIRETFHGALGVVPGTDYDPHENDELAQDFASLVKPKDIVSVFIPSLSEEKVDDFNHSGATLKRVVEEGILLPVIMGRWNRTADGRSFPTPYLAFFEPAKKVAKSTGKAKSKKTRFTRK
jgi:hypothetical protein